MIAFANVKTVDTIRLIFLVFSFADCQYYANIFQLMIQLLESCMWNVNVTCEVEVSGESLTCG